MRSLPTKHKHGVPLPIKGFWIYIRKITSTSPGANELNVCATHLFYHDAAMQFEFLSLPLGELDCRDTIFQKLCIVGAQPTIYSIVINMGIPPI